MAGGYCYLLAFACEQSFKRDYVSKYGFRQLGKNLFVELADAERLINIYSNGR